MYQTFRNMKIEHAVIGLEQREEYYPYFCTPRNAEIIGWAGVDGIHYCTVPEFGEMIFAVSPMNVGDYVHPVASSFRQLLGLLLTCGDMAALEQCYAWDEEQFKAFMIDCPITQAQQEVLDVLREKFGLEPIADVFGCVKTLQREFDLSKIPYTEDYYDTDMNPAAPVQKEWKVTYDGGFWGGQGKAGEELPVGKRFQWGEESWYIPAVYVCGKGLVVDICREAAPEKVLTYIEKWDLYNEEHNHYTKEQQAQMEKEHPLRTDFYGKAVLNGKTLISNHGSSVTWLPESCVPVEYRQDTEAKQVIAHYGLDESRGWSIHRCSYPWATARKPKLRSLRIELEREPEQVSGIRFPSPAPGESVAFTHPETGEAHRLTVLEYDAGQLPANFRLDSSMEYPRHYTMMCYTVEPEIRGLTVQDAEEGDQPRQKKAEPGQLSAEEAAALALIGGADGPVAASAAAIGIIGGSDGPTAIILGSPKKQAACSALRFAPVEKAQWQLRFSVKRMEDISVEIF